jgi:hypothetical protein
MSDKKFLGRYFQAVLDKLRADALHYNRELPHHGLAGAENEQAIGDVIRNFLPRKFGVEINALVIDRHGAVSKQCDIVIYDDERFPKYFRKVFPIELVYCVIEVKTILTSQQASEALDNLRKLNELDFRPQLTSFWQTRTKEQKLLHHPPLNAVFAYESDTTCFETFARWFPFQFLGEGVRAEYPEIRSFLACALNQGIIDMCSTNGFVRRWLAEAEESRRSQSLPARAYDQDLFVDPAKSLFLFLELLWTRLSTHPLHPGFDIRSYLDEELGKVIQVTDERVYLQNSDQPE